MTPGTAFKAFNARALHYTRLERLASDKHASLLCPVVRYDEKKVMRLRHQALLKLGIEPSIDPMFWVRWVLSDVILSDVILSDVILIVRRYIVRRYIVRRPI